NSRLPTTLNARDQPPAEVSDQRVSGLTGAVHESLWKQLMLGYYVNEYQSAAIDAYHRLKSTLAEELGVEPAPTIRALYHKILRQLPMDDLVGRVTRGRVDLRGGNGAKVEELTESDKDLLPIGLA
ncbi:BTAD domain-containing putative transcriptional regulator, partial [Mycobacterium tuberculosis]|uniref:BTAD domain-containing putative transcriptional regulator n=1 Tax=Mycobacterium tuberculosis TaxID=1773 RepID=UPI0004F39CD8